MVKIMNEEFIWPAWLCWIIPLIGAGLTPIFAKIHPKFRNYMAVLFSFAAALSAGFLIPYLKHPEQIENQISWVLVPGAPILQEIKAGVIIDPLSIIMANIVAWISFLIMVYSLKYMEEDPSLTRYWFFMNLFIGNMLLLVMSNNFIQMLFGWEGVGLCSYALIGFWYKDSKEDWLKCWVGEGKEAYPPSHCGLKAFLTTRAGDVGLLIGIFMILAFAGTLNFIELQKGAILKVPLWILVPAAIFLFIGPIGKSAQLPLMEWLPDAMAGPTTVSALIHAATMVKAGVYLVGRVFPIFYEAAWQNGAPNNLILFFYVIGWIGALTAFASASQAMASTEIKKVLAYSTVSQIGYMMIGLGVAGSTAEFAIGYTGGLFHLMSHALFKAALFLGAGAAIHAAESRFMYHMGGLKRVMPITFWSMALTSFSLMGVPILFSGFWSKDMILEASLLAGKYWIFILGALTVALTSFYSIRMLGLTFFGEKSERIIELEKEGKPPKEAPALMWIPYALMAAATITLGVTGFYVKSWLEHLLHEFLSSIIPVKIASFTEPLAETSLTQQATLITTGVSIIMLLIGAIPAYLIYIKRIKNPKEIVGKGLKPLWNFLYNRWYINRLYYKLFVDSTIGLSKFSFNYIERKAIDGFNYLLANVTVKFVNQFRKTHTGVLNYNVMGMLLGIILLLLILLKIAFG
jgi:NADH-quinone oxidoreductase subunit L